MGRGNNSAALLPLREIEVNLLVTPQWLAAAYSQLQQYVMLRERQAAASGDEVSAYNYVVLLGSLSVHRTRNGTPAEALQTHLLPDLLAFERGSSTDRRRDCYVYVRTQLERLLIGLPVLP